MEKNVLKEKILVAINRVLKNNKIDKTDKIDRTIKKAIKKIVNKANKPIVS